MTTQTTKLTTDGPPDKAGRQYYKPIIAKVIGESQYNAAKRAKGDNDLQFALEGLNGYWQWSRQPALVVGQRYLFGLATRAKVGPNTKPGALYMDIVTVAPPDAPAFDANGTEYRDAGTDEEAWPKPVDKEEAEPPTEAASNAPVPRSPLAGIEVPPEWKNPIEYHIHMKAIERASIETQVAYKGLIEVLPSVEDPIERVRITAVIQELAARLGRFTWPERDVVENNGEGAPQ